MKNIWLIGLLFLYSLKIIAQNSSEIETKRVRGAYQTYQEFLTNKPGIIDSFYVKSKERSNAAWKGTYSLTPMYAGTTKKIKKIWGFCNGDTSYIFHQSEFFPIKIVGDKYWFVGYDIVDISGAGVAGVIGGAIGGAIYGATAVTKARSNKTYYKIDSITGNAIHPYPSKSTQPQVYTTKLVIYRKAIKESDEPFRFVVNDTIKYSFVPKSIATIDFQITVDSVKICYANDFNECLNVKLNIEENTYIQCSLLKKNNDPQLIEVSVDDGSYNAYSLRKYVKERE